MKPLVLSVGGATLSALAFPPFGPGILILGGVALFLYALRMAETKTQGLLLGGLYGLGFFGGLMWWLVELELIALILVPVQAAFLAVYGWWLSRYNDRSPGTWLLLAVGGWAVMELVRYHFPVGGLEWGAAGYALSDNEVTRIPAAFIGTSGLTLLIVLLSAEIAVAFTNPSRRRVVAPIATAAIVMGVLVVFYPASDGVGEERVAIVQGSTPCPFEHCPPDERLRTFRQHLELTRAIEPGSVDLVVWSEGSTGSTNADPVLNGEVREAIGAEARRIGAPMLVGGDRVVSDTEWINANVYFNAEGEIVGEYRKQHPVPFGEYIPWRPVFGRIPATDRVPRDMIRGDGPMVFDNELGSVISFEGGFARYPLQARRAGADVIVVATNEASYGPEAPTADQFIGMTRMRAVELGVPVVHAAVTGKSTIIDSHGSFTGTTDLGTVEVYSGELDGPITTPYVVIGNSVMYLAALVGLLMWGRLRWLVGSEDPSHEEE